MEKPDVQSLLNKNQVLWDNMLANVGLQLQQPIIPEPTEGTMKELIDFMKQLAKREKGV
jgi:hypothetical protein